MNKNRKLMVRAREEKKLNDFKNAMEIMKGAGNGSNIRKGDKVKINVDKIKAYPHYISCSQKYKDEIERMRDVVFVADTEDNGLTFFPEGNDTYIYLYTDLILVERGEDGNGDSI